MNDKEWEEGSMDDIADRDGWAGNARADGVSVYSFRSDVSGVVLWGVKGTDGFSTTLCPCCNHVLRSQHTAQRLADAMYPRQEQP